MAQKKHNWKRFWTGRDGRISLADGGYLYDPDSKWGRLQNPDVAAFSSIAGMPCLILLGEPGIGKSHALASEYSDLSIAITEEAGEKLLIDLRSIGSDYLFYRKLVENGIFAHWKEGSHHLHLFLDSLDECLLRVDTIAALILEELRECPIDRLFLRVACRTADWPSLLEDGLKQLWEKSSIGVYELAPLRRTDVIEAAKANELDSQKFLHEIERMEAVPLAIKPVTLGFLINTYKRTGSFPRSQTELYRDGCRILCEEVSKSRRGARLSGKLTAKQRMIVASRIAAATVFANKYAVWSGLNLGNVPEEDVTVSDLSGGSESSYATTFPINEEAIRETLGTGLFTSMGPDRMGWAHQTYAEFLAATYVVEKDLSLPQIMSLIVHPSDPAKKLAPQLHEVAAWLASMDPRVFAEIIKIDPQVLLRSDIATMAAEDRERLVESLLDLLESGESVPPDWGLQKHYGKLDHPHLGMQLRPFLQNGSRSILARQAAIDIVEACELKTVQEDLVHLALNPEEPVSIRVEATCAISRIADEDVKSKLVPLVEGEAGEDSEDRLKGYGLSAVWPNHVSAGDLFAILTPPKRQSYWGPYQHFLHEDLAKHLDLSDLPIALQWVAAEERRQFRSDSFEVLKDRIMLKAWEHLESPHVLEPFARAALSRMLHHDGAVRGEHDPPFRSMVQESDAKRRLVLGAMAQLVSASDGVISHIAHSDTPFALGKDIEWMIDLLKAEPSTEVQHTLAQLIKRVFWWNEPSHVNAILIACNNLPILAEVFEDLINPVELDSLLAQKLREQHKRFQEVQERKQPLLNPPPSERIASLLDEIESGNMNAWWVMNMDMTLEPTSTHYGNELESDLTALPGWKAADEPTRERIVRAAGSYVLEETLDPEEWLGKSVFHRPSNAGVRALRLLLERNPEFIEGISPEVWKKWAVAILTSPWSGSGDDEDVLRTLVKMAYLNNADEMIRALLIVIDEQDRAHGTVFIIDRVEHCWDEKLGAAIFEKAKDEGLKPKSAGNLFEELVKHRVYEAYGHIRSLLDALPNEESGQEKARYAAEALLHDSEVTWPFVWPVLQLDERFGRKVLESISYEDRRSGMIAGSLSERQLAELFIWLTRQYPHEEDLKHDEVYSVGPRDSIAKWRDGVLRHLKQRGTTEACEVIAHIMRELPHLTWLKWTLLDAREITRRQTWFPPAPRDVIRLTTGPQLRLVQDGAQLLSVLSESLKRLEMKLHDETPAVEDLWYPAPATRGRFRPRDENMFSNYVKRHLDGDLRDRAIIVNREVEIRRSVGPGTGERTDILVDAIVRSPNGESLDSIAAIIEVKGCWHAELFEAMQTQLVERYLERNRCQNGLYLVGWFNCDYWDDRDD